MDRRSFVQTLAAIPAANVLSAAARGALSKEPFVGIQIAPHSILDEGIEYCLDLLKETARINALLVYTHKYYGASGRPPEVLAHDHGVPVRDERRRKLPKVWVKHQEKYFQDTILRHQKPNPEHEYHDRDLFRELVDPARARGMKIYTRILEPQTTNGLGFIENWEKVLTVDINGNRGRGPCWNHPEYRAWIVATVKDLFENYELDGIQYGAERVGPLSEVLFRGWVPTCFCQHCVQRNRDKGIDPDRARKGYRELHTLMVDVEKGKEKPIDGVITSVLRVFHKYHEVFAWNYQWFLTDEEIGREVYSTIKSIQPSAQVGCHIDHQRSSWDVFYRAAVSYSDIAEWADFIKPILYHDILGPRLRWWVLERMNKLVLSDLTLEQSLELFYAVIGYDKNREPNLQELDTTGLSPDYVYRETKRCVEGVNGKAAVYSGIGFDVPWHSPKGQVHFPSDPDNVYKAVMKAFEAGAGGIVASREYGEMRVPNLRAVGRAVDEWSS